MSNHRYWRGTLQLFDEGLQDYRDASEAEIEAYRTKHLLEGADLSINPMKPGKSTYTTTLVPALTDEMIDRANRYMNSLLVACPLPPLFRWHDLWQAIWCNDRDRNTLPLSLNRRPSKDEP